MNGAGVLAVAAAGAAAALATPAPRRGALQGLTGPSGTASRTPRRRWVASARHLVIAGTSAVVVLTAVAGSGVVIWLLGGLTVAALLRRRAGLDEQRRRELALRRQLPLALDLLAAALSSGATMPAALAVSAEAGGAPLGDQLAHVSRALLLGASAAEAWQPLARDPPLRPLVRLAVRSAGGSAMAASCHRLAESERRSTLFEVRRRVRQAGVLATLPLSLCLLPAFVLVGVVPVVAGLLRSLPL